jgi:4-alpha-glucanotransferase
MRLLRRSFHRLHGRREARYPDDSSAFTEHNVLAGGLRPLRRVEEAHGERVWTAWDAGAASRDPAALARWRNQLATEIQFRKYLQYVFFRQWSALRAYCRERGVSIIGERIGGLRLCQRTN